MEEDLEAEFVNVKQQPSSDGTSSGTPVDIGDLMSGGTYIVMVQYSEPVAIISVTLMLDSASVENARLTVQATVDGTTKNTIIEPALNNKASKNMQSDMHHSNYV